MKLAFAHAVTVAGSLAIAMADPVSMPAPTNSTVQGGSQRSLGQLCDWYAPNNGLNAWFYNSLANGPLRCSKEEDTQFWSMLNAYRSGGTQGIHWKYTDNQNDGQCLTNWTYYSSDGQTVIEKNIGRTTFNGDTRRWCALPVYRSGGVLGKQWDYCVQICYDSPP